MTQSSLDSILDQTLDDLADMPSIALFPNGAHKVNIEFKFNAAKPDNVQLQLVYVECLELSDPTAASPAPDDKCSVFYNLRKKDGTPNEYAQGALKELVKTLKPVFNGSNIKETLENSKGAEVVVVTKIRTGKGEYEGRDSMDIVKMDVV